LISTVFGYPNDSLCSAQLLEGLNSTPFDSTCCPRLAPSGWAQA